MRENCTYGSEGGEGSALPDPYLANSWISEVMVSNHHPDIIRKALALFAILAAAGLFAITPWGLGLTPDSLAYMSAARSVAEQGDFEALPTHWPPVYPLMLAATSIVVGDIGIGARLLQGSFLAMNVLLIAALIMRRGDTAHRAVSFLALAFVIMLSLQPSIWQVHLHLWTEPAFLVLCMTNILLLERSLRDSNAWRWLILAAVAAGVAVLVRYVGLFLIAANALILLLVASSWSMRDRLFRVVVVATLSSTPFMIWWAANQLRAAGSEIRVLSFHPISENHIQQALETFAGWIGLGPAWGLAVLLTLLLLTLLPWARKNGDSETNTLARVLSLYTLSYAAFITASISWADAHTPLDARILVPIFPSAFMLALDRISVIRHRRYRMMGILLLFTPLLLNVPTSMAAWEASFRDGIGLGSRSVQEMPALRFISALPASWKVYTNTPEVFELYLDQNAVMFPRFTDPVTRKPNSVYREQMATMASEADLMVFFGIGSYRWYLPTGDELDAIAGFDLVYLQSDAAIWMRNEHVPNAGQGKQGQ
jgi:hypothetical protein